MSNIQTIGSTAMHIEKISNTQWLVTCNDVVTSTDGENISFTIAVPISEKSVGDVQQQAIRRAAELLRSLVED